MIYYAIRHKPTGKYLPGWGSRRGRRGFTHDTPHDPKVVPPRLFSEQRYAKIALKHWLKGKTSVWQSGDPFEGYDEDWKTFPVPSRKADEMEIVELRLIDSATYAKLEMYA